MPSTRPPRAALPVLLLAGLLGGCGGNQQAFAPPCPSAAILADAADLSRYQGTGRDLTDLVLEGRVTGLSGKCSAEKDGTSLRTEVTVRMQVGRGPASRTREAELNYFVAATRGGEILDKQVFPLHVEFPPNTDRISLASVPVRLSLPTPKGTSGAAYRILVGFQVSPAELAVNRARSER